MVRKFWEVIHKLHVVQSLSMASLMQTVIVSNIIDCMQIYKKEADKEKTKRSNQISVEFVTNFSFKAKSDVCEPTQ